MKADFGADSSFSGGASGYAKAMQAGLPVRQTGLPVRQTGMRQLNIEKLQIHEII